MDESSRDRISIEKTESYSVESGLPVLIELHIDQSGLNRSNRDQPETRYYCPESGCKASFKRKYDIDRHRQAKHEQSKNFFCPVKGCRCSPEPDLNQWDLWSFGSWDCTRNRLKSKELTNDLNNGYRKGLLYGFHRKDKLLKHVARYHKELGPELASLMEEKDACQGDPLLVEIQRFCAGGVFVWRGYVDLKRIQRKDSSWSDWLGYGCDEVAARGFNLWTNPETSKASSVSNISYDICQPSPGSTSNSTQMFGYSGMLNFEGGTKQLSQGQHMQPVATQLGYGAFPYWSTDQLINNSNGQNVWLPSRQPNNLNLLSADGHVNDWTPNSNNFILDPMPEFSNGVDICVGLLDFSNFNTGFIPSMQTSQAKDGIMGALDSTLDFNNVLFENILMNPNTSLDITQAGYR